MTISVRAPGERETTGYTQVVMPIDFSSLSWRALSLANSISSAYAIPRRLVHVDTSSPWLDEGASRLMLKATPSGEPVDVEVVAARTPEDGVLRILDESPSSLLVISAHGHTAAAELALGSTAEQMLRKWTGPVLAVGPRYRPVARVPRRIVVCVDPALSPPTGLMTDVRSFADRFKVPVRLLTVSNYSAVTDVELIRDDQHRLNQLANVLERDGLPASIIRVHGGRSAHEIVQYADQQPGTVIALATHAHTLPGRFVLGSVAMTVLRQAASPVLLRSVS
jgi:nucleotide-binding universal stress UspA family protein